MERHINKRIKFLLLEIVQDKEETEELILRNTFLNSRPKPLQNSEKSSTARQKLKKVHWIDSENEEAKLVTVIPRKVPVGSPKKVAKTPNNNTNNHKPIIKPAIGNIKLQEETDITYITIKKKDSQGNVETENYSATDYLDQLEKIGESQMVQNKKGFIKLNNAGPTNLKKSMIH